LDDEIWQKGTLATDFVMYNPYNGIPSKYRSEVRILYDDDALYIGAMLFDPEPDSIFVELGARDEGNLNADNFWIDISPFNDGLYGEQFKVSASNVQADIKLNSSDDYHREDTWDAVWESATGITEEGWCAEIRIPYSALRFPKSGEQTWGINFWREVRRVRETSSWSFVTKEYGSSVAHMGGLTGIANITPPLRLSLTPYVSGYIENVSDQPGVGTSYNGGLDIKVGLTESFTLDATLIPDFGQVQSDDHVLNLSPYEVKYNEKRPFFMEGTELFNKGDIFYSRRIGGRPHLSGELYDQLEPGETVTRNPSEVQLINATKISGRTKNGLGIGIFNAVTGSVWAEVTNTATGESRKIRTEPLTNYNMIVLDQSLKNNSYLSFANTNVIRAGVKDENFYTANVSNIQSLLKTNNKLYSVSGSATLSQKYFTGAEADLGHALEFNVGKTGGSFRADYNFSMMSDRYDPNDMGYLRRNNEFEHSLDFSYNTYEPFGNIMSTRNSLELNYNQLFMPRAYTSADIELGSMLILMNYWSLSFDAGIKPWGEDDYFEPRWSDMSRFYHRPPGMEFRLRGDTDRSKKLYVEAELEYFKRWSAYNQRGFAWSLAPEYKVSRRFSFGYALDISRDFNDIGYVDASIYDDIIFGKRDVTTITNTLS
ncbi:MAG: carbohydrate binding family 9 domain-containing protein, partial [Bacteroidales bacterium]|nr:carbohydrate binding family 9 domain-containing protein [Bacteroidales bacterium]